MLEYTIKKHFKDKANPNKIIVVYDYLFPIRGNVAGETVNITDTWLTYDYSDNTWEIEYNFDSDDNGPTTLFHDEIALIYHIIEAINTPAFKVLYT